MRYQPVGQLVQGMVIARVCALAQFVELAALSQPAGKPQLSDVFSGIGQRADHCDRLTCLVPLSQPAGKLTPGMIVATFGPVAQLINLVVICQAIRLPPLGRVAWVCSWRLGQCPTSLARSCRHDRGPPGCGHP